MDGPVVSLWHAKLRHPPISVLIGALALVVVLDGVLLAQATRTPPPIDKITTLSWTSNGTSLYSGAGFEMYAGSKVPLVLTDTNAGFSSEFFASASVSPSTFTVVSTLLPIVHPGTTENLTVTVLAPSGSYSGPLTVTLA
jgi:hypothetical protein